MPLRNLLIIAAVIFAFALQTLREWQSHGRTLLETFSQWEWGANFLLYWLASSIGIAVIFLGIDLLRRRTQDQPRK